MSRVTRAVTDCSFRQDNTATRKHGREMASAKTPRDEKDDTYIVTEQVGHLLRKAYQRHLSIFQQQANDYNLTSVQFVTLCKLHDLGPSSQTELVDATAVDQATIRGIIERLHARGLIDVSRDSRDGRKVIMSLRPEGEAILAKMYPRGRLISERTMDPLNPAERVALLYLLRKISESPNSR